MHSAKIMSHRNTDNPCILLDKVGDWPAALHVILADLFALVDQEADKILVESLSQVWSQKEFL